VLFSLGMEQENPQATENEPYLGPAWAVAMLILYALKKLFPAEQYSLLWWFQVYVISIVISVTIFALIKRYQFYKSEENNKTSRNPL
jgi:hypothetical protein